MKIDWEKPLETLEGQPAFAAKLGERYAACLARNPEYPWLVDADGRATSRRGSCFDLRNVPDLDDEGHRPTPHEPVKGVTLETDVDNIGNSKAGAYVFIDGIPCGFIDSPGYRLLALNQADRLMCEGSVSPITAKRAWEPDHVDLVALRDRIRAERAAAKPKAYTLETWPAEATRLRGIAWSEGEWSMIQHVGPDGIVIRVATGKGSILSLAWPDLDESWLWSADGKAWQPCGVVG